MNKTERATKPRATEPPDARHIQRYGDTKVQLLPCPFCGGRAFYNACMGETPDRRRDEATSCGCDRCGCHGPMSATLDRAARAWNRRPKIAPSGEERS